MQTSGHELSCKDSGEIEMEILVSLIASDQGCFIFKTQTDKLRWTDKQTNRQTDGQTQTQTDSQTGR